MAGEVWQWNEAQIGDRVINGSSWSNAASDASNRSAETEANPAQTTLVIGFRVASIADIPEPSSIILAALGFTGVAAWGWRRRKKLGLS